MLLLVLAASACSDSRAAIEPGAFRPPSAADAFWLSATGLYRDVARKELASDVRAFEPAFALWSDGAAKQRWLRLPRGAKVDTRDVDHWLFPVGTMLFKEFSRDGRRIETRVIAKAGADAKDVWLGAFLWNEDESDARWVPEGQRDARGTAHDVPNERQCATCHGDPARVLGFSAVQQPGVDPQLVTNPPAEPFTPPGDAVTRAALGYLHANCGHCHNPSGSARPDTDMNLQLSAADSQAADTNAERTTRDRPLQSYANRGPRLRVVRGQPDASGLLVRMQRTESESRMPPLGTEQIDERGIAAVRAWIEKL